MLVLRVITLPSVLLSSLVFIVLVTPSKELTEIFTRAVFELFIITFSFIIVSISLISFLNLNRVKLRLDPRDGNELLSNYKVLLLIGVFIVIGSSYSYWSGAIHDYEYAYTFQWVAILQGYSPWTGYGFLYRVSRYGPLYNSLALIYYIDPLAPKILFTLIWIACSIFIISIFLKSKKNDPILLFSFIIFLLFNPFIWIEVPYYGHFDILVAACCLVAIHLRRQNNLLSSGVVLGLGVLLKFYPLAILPFLMLDNKRISFGPLVGCALVITIGFFVSYSIWGVSTFSPITIAIERIPKHLSIFRFLIGELSPLHRFGPHYWTITTNLIRFNAYIMLFFLLLVSGFCFFRKIDPILGSILGLITALTFYKVGHQQFFIALFLLVPYWYATSDVIISARTRIILPMMYYFIWLNVYHFIYAYFGEMTTEKWAWMRDFGGLPTFIFACWIIISAIKWGKYQNKLTNHY